MQRWFLAAAESFDVISSCSRADWLMFDWFLPAQVLWWRTGISLAPKMWLALSSSWWSGRRLWRLQLCPSPSPSSPRFLQPAVKLTRPLWALDRGLWSAFACAKVGRTLSRVQQALSWSYEEEMKPFMPPLSDAEFHSYLNGQGQLTRPEELRLRIYHGGVEPSLRKVQHRCFN